MRFNFKKKLCRESPAQLTVQETCLRYILQLNRITKSLTSFYTNLSIFGLKYEGEVGCNYFHPNILIVPDFWNMVKKLLMRRKNTSDRREITLRSEPAQKRWWKIETVKVVFLVAPSSTEIFPGEDQSSPACIAPSGENPSAAAMEPGFPSELWRKQECKSGFQEYSTCWLIWNSLMNG